MVEVKKKKRIKGLENDHLISKMVLPSIDPALINK